MRIATYEILETIGAGHSGVVYRALDTRLGRVVALKVLRNAVATQVGLSRFRREAELLARLEHPHIATLYEVGDDDGQFFLAMKLVEGRTLRKASEELLQKPTLVASVLAGVAMALQHAHEHGVLHRDLKPDNILLDGQAMAHLVDFGLALGLEGADRLTSTGVIVGSPAYLSPEQAAGLKDLPVASDLFSVGVILYELLTGLLPFTGSTPMATLLAILHQPVAPPHAVVSHPVQPDLEAVCLKCLEKDPANRYASAAELADDLEKIAKGMPLRGRRRNRFHRFRPSRRVAYATGTLALAVVLFYGVSTLIPAAGENLPEDEAALLADCAIDMKFAQEALDHRRDDFSRFLQAVAPHYDRLQRGVPVPEWAPLLKRYPQTNLALVCTLPSQTESRYYWAKDGRLMIHGEVEVKYRMGEKLGKPVRKQDLARFEYVGRGIETTVSELFTSPDGQAIIWKSVDGKLLMTCGGLPSVLRIGVAEWGFNSTGSAYWNVWDAEKLKVKIVRREETDESMKIP